MNEKQARKNLILFPLGTVGRDMVYNLFTNFLLTYVLFTQNLTAGQLSAITAIMVAARVFDALNDPIMGNIIDRTRSRWGKFKPWLLIGILTTSVVVYLAFNTSLTGWSFVWFFGIIYFFYSITYTMHDISFWGMIPSLSTNAHERDQLTSRTNLFAGIGGTLAGLLIPMLTTGSGAWGGSTGVAYGRVALAVALLAPFFLAFTIAGVKENRDYEKEAAPPLSFKKIVSTIGGNDQLLWISVIFLLQQIGNDMIIGGVGSTYIYFEFGYEGGLYSLFSTVGMAATAFLMIFYPRLSSRFSRKAMMGRMMIAGFAGYGLMLAAGLLLPAGATVKFWAITAGYMISNLGNYGFYLIMMISILNTVEYNEYTHGRRDDAIIASIRPFFTKLASALVVAMTSLAYILFGITDFTNRISDFERQTSMGLISEEAKLAGIAGVLSETGNAQTLGLLLVMCLVPCLFMFASFRLYGRHYKLDEEEYSRILKELEARH